MCGSCLCSKKANVTRGQMSVTKGPSCARQTGMWNFPGSPHYYILCNSPRDTLAGIASKYLEASFSNEINQTHQIIDDLRLQRLRAWEVLQIANGLPNNGKERKKTKGHFFYECAIYVIFFNLTICKVPFLWTRPSHTYLLCSFWAAPSDSQLGLND